MKVFRAVQILVLLANLVYVGSIFRLYGWSAISPWQTPQDVAQVKLLLIAVVVLPAAIIALWSPVTGSVLQFAAAFVGDQLHAGYPMPALHRSAHQIMLAAGIVIIVSVFHSVSSVTKEAFEEPSPEQSS